MAYGTYGYQTPARKGTLVGMAEWITGKKATANTEFGDPVFYKLGDDVNCYKPSANFVTVTLSGAVVTDNVMTSTVTVYDAGGVGTSTTVANTFDTDSATTITAHIALLEAVTNVTAAEVTGDHNFSVTNALGYGISIVTVLTLGATRATASYALSNATFKFGGIAGLMDRSDNTTRGLYPVGDFVNVIEKATIVVAIDEALSGVFGKPAYLIYDPSNAKYGKFTTSSTNTYDTGCVFASNPITVDATHHYVELEVRGIK